MRLLNVVKHAITGVEVIFGGFSLGLLVASMWNLFKHNSVLFLAPRTLIFGGISLGTMGAVVSWMGSNKSKAHFLLYPTNSTDPVNPTERIIKARQAFPHILSALFLTAMTVAMSATYIGVAQYNGDMARMSKMIKDIWMGASSAELFKIQSWGRCCGYANLKDYVQEPCQADKPCMQVMLSFYSVMTRSLVAPVMGMTAAGGILVLALAWMAAKTKMMERAERRHIRENEESTAPKTIFQ